MTATLAPAQEHHQAQLFDPDTLGAPAADPDQHLATATPVAPPRPAPQPARRIEHPRDPEVRAIKQLRTLATRDSDQTAADDDMIAQTATLVQLLVTHDQRNEAGDSLSSIAAEAGFAPSVAARILHELGVRLAQSERDPVDATITVRGAPSLDLGAAANDGQPIVTIPREVPAYARQQVANLTAKLANHDDVTPFVRRFLQRGVAHALDMAARYALVGMTASFIQRVAVRFRLGNIETLPELVQEPEWTNTELAGQIVRAWQLLDVARRDAVEAVRTLANRHSDMQADEIREQLTRCRWLSEAELQQLHHALDTLGDSASFRQELAFFAQRIRQERQRARAASEQARRYISSKYEPMCVGHLHASQVDRYLRLLDWMHDDLALRAAETDLFEHLCTHHPDLAQDEDLVRHRIRLALQFPGGVEVLTRCLDQRDARLAWDDDLRRFLRTARPQPARA